MGSKQTYSTYFSELTLSDEDIKQLHIVELTILKDLNKVCEENNIKYMLSGGSVLGAIRHNGFIPWDDDIDVMMYRDDYFRLQEAFNKTFPDKYTIVYNYNDKTFVGKSMKIYLNNTTYVELEQENYPQPNGLFIDVFPIDNIPSNKFVRKIRGLLHDFAYLATGAIYCYKYPSTTIINKSKTEKEVKKFYNKKRIIGAFLSVFFGFNFYMNIAKKMANYNKETKYEGIPTGIRYNREVFEKGFFDKTILHEFEGEMYPIPANYDRYLTNLYGDYMKLPPIEKREKHIATKIKF